MWSIISRILRRNALKFSASRSGNVALLFSVALVPLAMGGGFAIDYSRRVHYTELLQASADASALAGMQAVALGGNGSQAEARARQHFNAAVADKKLHVASFSTSYNAGAQSLQVNATGTAPTQIMKAFGFSNVAFAVKSVAAYRPGPAKTWPVCVIVDADTQVHTLMTVDSARLEFNKCMVQVNTTNWDAVEARDSSSIASNDGENCFVGDIHKGNVTPPKNPSCTPLADPFKGKAMPSSASKCDFTAKTYDAPTTLQPGTYCGDTNINARVKMAPGVYVIKDGNLTLGGNADVTAHHVTILLTGNGPNFYMKDNARMDLTAGTHGHFAGFAIYLDNNSSASACSAYVNGDQIILSNSVDLAEVPPGKKKFTAAQRYGIANCTNAIRNNAVLTASGVIYTAKATFYAGDQATVNLTGSFISGFLLGEGNARFNLNGALPSSSALAAILQKQSESSDPTKMVKLVQ